MPPVGLPLHPAYVDHSKLCGKGSRESVKTLYTAGAARLSRRRTHVARIVTRRVLLLDAKQTSQCVPTHRLPGAERDDWLTSG